jgi:hypothetical protein
VLKTAWLLFATNWFAEESKNLETKESIEGKPSPIRRARLINCLKKVKQEWDNLKDPDHTNPFYIGAFVYIGTRKRVLENLIIQWEQPTMVNQIEIPLKK